jgi:hypothetical protein
MSTHSSLIRCMFERPTEHCLNACILSLHMVKSILWIAFLVLALWNHCQQSICVCCVCMFRGECRQYQLYSRWIDQGLNPWCAPTSFEHVNSFFRKSCLLQTYVVLLYISFVYCLFQNTCMTKNESRSLKLLHNLSSACVQYIGNGHDFAGWDESNTLHTLGTRHGDGT